MDELLTLSHVYAGYDKRDIIQDVSVSLPRGQFCALLGANGSGKTTLLKTVCGFLPFRGDCRFLGKPLGDFSPKERSRHMGYLAQRGGVTIPLSVGDVVLMGCNPVLGVFQQPGKTPPGSCAGGAGTGRAGVSLGKGLFIPQRRTAAAGAVCQKPGALPGAAGAG